MQKSSRSNKKKRAKQVVETRFLLFKIFLRWQCKGKLWIYSTAAFVFFVFTTKYALVALIRVKVCVH